MKHIFAILVQTNSALVILNLKVNIKPLVRKKSDGIQHLKALQTAGLNNIHLLPTFDIATVDEDDSKTSGYK